MKDRTLNINIGILGHVDSGKTSLAKSLSHISSTAAFDKNPQSQERGITIDLGFSSLKCPISDNLKQTNDGLECILYTLVDCPGHASLIRTVIGGAQIIDLIILVVDVCKGIQTQTAECLVLGEITCRRLIVVLNKIDLLPEGKRDSLVQKMKKKMHLTLADTVFKDSPIVCMAAKPSGSEHASEPAVGVEKLIQTLGEHAVLPERHPDKPFLFAVDHCFGIRGQGTVLTGTVLQGSVSVGDNVEIPSLRVEKKVKSMQMFRENVEYAEQGDRLGICVKQLDASQLERGIVCAPNYSSCAYAGVMPMNKIKYFKFSIRSGAKFHISIGYETVIAKITLFRSSRVEDDQFDFANEYVYVDELCDNDNEDKSGVQQKENFKHFMLLEFECPVLTTPHCLVIGSKMDIDIHKNTCRLAFHGNLIFVYNDKNYATSDLPKLKIYTTKTKTGTVDRIVNEFEVIGRNIFKKETNMQLFIGCKVNFSTGEHGVIESGFGQSGKIKIRVPEGLSENSISRVPGRRKAKASAPIPGNKAASLEAVTFTLHFKKYKYDQSKKIVQ